MVGFGGMNDEQRRNNCISYRASVSRDVDDLLKELIQLTRAQENDLPYLRDGNVVGAKLNKTMGGRLPEGMDVHVSWGLKGIYNSGVVPGKTRLFKTVTETVEFVSRWTRVLDKEPQLKNTPFAFLGQLENQFGPYNVVMARLMQEYPDGPQNRNRISFANIDRLNQDVTLAIRLGKKIIRYLEMNKDTLLKTVSYMLFLAYPGNYKVLKPLFEDVVPIINQEDALFRSTRQMLHRGNLKGANTLFVGLADRGDYDKSLNRYFRKSYVGSATTGRLRRIAIDVGNLSVISGRLGLVKITSLILRYLRDLELHIDVLAKIHNQMKKEIGFGYGFEEGDIQKFIDEVDDYVVALEDVRDDFVNNHRKRMILEMAKEVDYMTITTEIPVQKGTVEDTKDNIVNLEEYIPGTRAKSRRLAS
jgi:hypothetical protein